MMDEQIRRLSKLGVFRAGFWLGLGGAVAYQLMRFLDGLLAGLAGM
jgi:hypothetical protein